MPTLLYCATDIMICGVRTGDRVELYFLVGIKTKQCEVMKKTRISTSDRVLCHETSASGPRSSPEPGRGNRGEGTGASRKEAGKRFFAPKRALPDDDLLVPDFLTSPVIGI